MDLLKYFRRDTKQDEVTAAMSQELATLKTMMDAAQKSGDGALIGYDGGNVSWYDTGAGNTYGDHYTIYRGVDMLSNLGSSLPIKIYRGDHELEDEVLLTPGNFNVRKPHPNMSLNEILYMSLVYFFYKGELMIEITDDPFFHLNPLNPDHMTRVNNSVNWKHTTGSVTRIIKPENLIYVQLFNPDNAARGLGPVDVVKSDLLNEASAIDYNTNFFKNFGQIGGFFYDTDGKARSADMQAIVNQFKQLHRGTTKAGDALGLPNGIRYEDFNKSMVEMQYLESRKDIRDRILACLGIHKALFGVTDQVNRSVSEEATRMLWIHNLKPKMIRIQEKINQVLFRNYFPQYRFEYDFSEIAELRQAAESLMSQVKLYQSLGYTTNEINVKFNLGMEEITDAVGDMRLLPNSMVPANDFLMIEEPAPEPKPKKDDKDVVKAFFPEDKAYSINKFKRSQTNLFRKTAKLMAGKLGKYFSKELGQIMKIVLSQKSFKSSVDINVMLSEIQNQLTKNKELLMEVMKPTYKAGSLGADDLAIISIGGEGTPVASEAVVAAMTNEIVQINNYTYSLIRNQVKIGINEGDTIDGIAKRITKVYKFNSSRARTIARTEAGGVIHKTTDERYKESGVEKKRWLSAGDAEVRETHDDNDNMGAVDYDYTYSNGQTFPNDGNGGAAENINCRCTYIGVME